MPQFSVIVPVYNVEKYIGRCIESILEQTFGDFELILVDDGSSDRSFEVCNQYLLKDKRIKMIHQENKGVSAARNTGLKEATGKYIVFVDGDDTIERFFLYCLAQVDDNVDLVICGNKQISTKGKVSAVRQYEPEVILELTRENILQMIDNHSIDYIWAKRYKMDIIRQRNLFFDESLNLGEDTYFVACYLNESQSVQYIEKVVYQYYKYSHETLSSLNVNFNQRLSEANQKISDILEKKYGKISDAEIWKKKIYSDYPYIIFYILKNEKWGNIKKYQFLKSIFVLKEFEGFLKELNVYMNKESKIIQNIISTRSPLIVLFFWRLVEIKNEMRCRKTVKS